jgi:DNA-binding beta-propeller fold protein YncE
MISAKRIGCAVRVGVLACVAATLWLAAAAPAFAAPVYTLGGYVGFERGHEGGQFGSFGPNGVAIAPSSADVYVVDTGNNRVQEFGPQVTPSFLAAWGWDVNGGGSEQFEICTEASKCEQGAEGSGAGELANQEATGVAVDPVNHDVYATDSHNNRVEYFEAGGKYLGQFNGTEIDGVAAAKPAPAGLSFPIGIAVDAAGHLYVEDRGHDLIDRFSAGGEYECQITGTTPGSASECDPSGSASKTTTVAEGLSLGSANPEEGAGLAVDAAGNVYVANIGDGVVDEFSASGAFVRAFGEGVLSAPAAVTVDDAGDVFALSGEHTVYEFDSAGATVTELTLYTQNGSLGKVDALAVSPDGNRLYASVGSSQELLVYGRFAKPTTEPATTPVLGAAILQGTVNPEGLPVEGCEFEWGEGEPGGSFEHSVPCTQTPAEIGAGEAPVAVSAELSGLTPYKLYHYRVVARNSNGATHGKDVAMSASVDVFGFQLGGADALEINVSDPNAQQPSIEENGWQVANPQAPDSQAGSHPFAVTTRFLVNGESDGNLPLGMRPKDYYVELPAGFAGSVAKIPRCKISEMESDFYSQGLPFCPTASQVGVIRYFLPAPGTGRLEEQLLDPVYNMVPAPGAPAELAFSFVSSFPIPVTVQLRSDGDYGISAEVRNVSEQQEIAGAEMTLWGAPASPAHDRERFRPEGFAIGHGLPGNAEGGPLPAGTPEVPFLNNPTRCGAVQEATVMGDSWLHPGKLAEDGRPVPGSENWVTAHTQMYPDGITGCSKLTFEPRIEVEPSTSVADSPMGMTVAIRVPQSEDPNNLATPPLKDATVTLPQGVSIDPSAANGLGGCTPAQIKLHSEAAPECPNASQIGKLELTTPLLPEPPLSGRIYLSSEHAGNVFHIFLVIAGQGVLIKLEGSVEANEQTGQIVSRFTENPQLPFSELKLTFYGGSDAALASPQQCGTYATTSALEPWSQEGAERELGHALTTPSPLSEFKIESGCAGAFAPTFSAGTTNPTAGGFSPFSLTFSRKDGEQDLDGVSLTLPPGLTGKLAGVQECSNAQIEAAEHSSGIAEQANPSCPAASQLGPVQTGAGPGEKPFYVGGKVYLTGPYKGAPFGLVEIVPALAGPFDLGTVVVRQTIKIDPHTAQGIVGSNPLPTIIDGIPLRLRTVHVELNRPEFMLNPTNCSQLQITGTLTGEQGASAPQSVPFEVGNCATLPFKPAFTAFTRAKTSKEDGASLVIKVTQKPGEANIHKVDLELPVALPSRNSTLQKACTEAQFNANPAGCPEGSVIGTATAVTPVLQTPLTGPAYLVSHGGAAFPDVEYVLQADERGGDVEIVLDGKTQIKKGITYSHFETVPDAPVSSFETTLPEGSHSILTTEYPGRTNLCALSLVMPTTMVGQNGAQVTQNTSIAVTGCRLVTISKRKLSANSVILAFTLTKAGTVTVTGPGLKRYRKNLGAGAHQIKVALSRVGLSLRALHRKIEIKVALRSGKNAASATTALKL